MHSLFYIFFILSCIAFFFYYLWICLLSVFPRIKYYKDEKYPDETDLYFFILIPCLNEGKVIYKTVMNLLSLSVPNTMIIAIDDGSTDTTPDILNCINHPNFRMVSRALPSTQKGKGMALNDGFEVVIKTVNELGIDHSRAIIGVLDADTFIKSELLKRVAVIMNKDPKVGMVQSRIKISMCNCLLQSMQDLEFFTIINRMQNMREYTGTVAAAGNGQFSRLSAMETNNNKPWSDCLLEDFDFSLRLLLNGWHTHLIQDEHTCQQGISRYGKFINQRTRWAQGCIQCISYLNDIIKSKCLSFFGKVEIFSFLMLPWLTLISSVTVMFSWFLIIYTYLSKSSVLPFMLSPYPTAELISLLVVILIFVFLPGIYFSISYRRETKVNLYRSLLIGLFVPIYNILQAPAVLIAFCRQVVGIRSWVKTDHEND